MVISGVTVHDRHSLFSVFFFVIAKFRGGVELRMYVEVCQTRGIYLYFKVGFVESLVVWLRGVLVIPTVDPHFFSGSVTHPCT